MSAPDVSVLIVNFNGAGLLPDCLASVDQARGDLGVECIVVDNASVDDSLAVLARHDSVRVVPSSRNEGFARAMNRALPLAAGRYVMWLNPDCRLEPGSLPGAIHALEALGNPAILGPRLLGADGQTQPSALAWSSPARAIFHALGARSILRLALARSVARGVARWLPERSVREYLRTSVQAPEPRDVDWLTGACLLMRSAVARAIGPLDERYFMYCEDEAWCRAAAAAAIRRVWWPDWRAHHASRGSWSGSPYIECHYYKSALLYQRQYSPHEAWLVGFVFGCHALARAGAELIRQLLGVPHAALRKRLWLALTRWIVAGGPEPCGQIPPPAWPPRATGDQPLAG